MRTVVCIKQVPGSNEVRIDPVTHTIIRDSKQAITNPFDSYAIEQAVQLKEEHGGEVVALSMGIPATEWLLRDAVSRGADRGVLLTDRAFAGADTLATAYTLSRGIGEMGGADLILCGKMAVDGDTAQIGPELAEFLGIPHITDVSSVESVEDGEVTVTRVTDGGTQRLAVTLPALLTVIKDINMPRMPSIAGVRYSISARFERWGTEDLGIDPAMVGLEGSPTSVARTWTPERIVTAQSIEGEPGEQAVELVKIIREVLGDGPAQH